MFEVCCFVPVAAYGSARIFARSVWYSCGVTSSALYFLSNSASRASLAAGRFEGGARIGAKAAVAGAGFTPGFGWARRPGAAQFDPGLQLSDFLARGFAQMLSLLGRCLPGIGGVGRRFHEDRPWSGHGSTEPPPERRPGPEPVSLGVRRSFCALLHALSPGLRCPALLAKPKLRKAPGPGESLTFLQSAWLITYGKPPPDATAFPLAFMAGAPGPARAPERGRAPWNTRSAGGLRRV